MYKILNMVVADIELGLTLLSLMVWIGLLCFRGQFWQADQRLEELGTHSPYPSQKLYPSVCAVVPARNEADLLPVTLRSLLTQDYPGSFTSVLVDDQSTDGTASIAHKIAQDSNKSSQIEILFSQALPPGWTGKLWAMEQGIRHAQKLTPPPDYFLLTDADIEHDSKNLRQLVAKAEQEKLDLASLMVRLRCENFWEQLLIPAFVFFFQKLYPFRWVNNPTNSTAAAAGGCILIRREALNRIGGIQVVRQALIDDCALAQAVKSGAQAEGGNWSKGDNGELSKNASSAPSAPHSPSSGRIWLGLGSLTRSLRPYPSLASIWEMVARTAYTQLNYSPLLLLGTLSGMTLMYLVPPVGAIFGALTGSWSAAIAGLSGWLMMAWAYLPILRFYKCSPLLALGLPGVALLYTLMTLDSAVRHWQGRGGAWKGRVYSEVES
ncbi:MAG TPA: glycosyltransferase [Coleofasciculaceae cyanobacterium]|jgi:hopene-associated glycosyltransferase HpnB